MLSLTPAELINPRGLGGGGTWMKTWNGEMHKVRFFFVGRQGIAKTAASDGTFSGYYPVEFVCCEVKLCNLVAAQKMGIV